MSKHTSKNIQIGKRDYTYTDSECDTISLPQNGEKSVAQPLSCQASRVNALTLLVAVRRKRRNQCKSMSVVMAVVAVVEEVVVLTMMMMMMMMMIMRMRTMMMMIR